jgi:cell division topological specificity factor
LKDYLVGQGDEDKIMSWLDKLFGKKETSSNVAKNRLKMVLTHDRSQISPGLVELIKDDIIAVIAKHMAVDPGEVEVNLTRTPSESRLVAEVPLPARRR